MNKKLLLINPKTGVNSSQAGILNLPPLSLGYIAALTPSNWDIEIHDENLNRLPDGKEADLVGFTSMTSNAPRAYELAGRFKKKGIRTVMGGIHASMLPDEAEKYVDTVVVGEAESVWGRVIADFENNKLQKRYLGERLPLNNHVIPRRDLYSDEYTIKNFMQTARGCPKACDFCTVTAFNGKSYRVRPVDDVIAEIKQICSNSTGWLKHFFAVVDDNILGYGTKARNRAIELFKAMIDAKLNIRWITQVSINFAYDHEILELASRSGCRGVLIGLESISQNVLKIMKKGHNLRSSSQQVDYYKQAANNLHSHGIAICGSLIFGNDGEDKDIFKRTTDFILDAKIDSSYLCMLAPLPGTHLLQDYLKKGRIFRNNFPADWKYYNTWDLTFKPQGMTCTELENGLQYVYENTMSLPALTLRGISSLITNKDTYSTLIPFFWNKGYGGAYFDNFAANKANGTLAQSLEKLPDWSPEPIPILSSPYLNQEQVG